MTSYKALEVPVVHKPCPLLVWLKDPETGSLFPVKASTTPVKEFWTIAPGEFILRTAESCIRVHI